MARIKFTVVGAIPIDTRREFRKMRRINYDVDHAEDFLQLEEADPDGIVQKCPYTDIDAYESPTERYSDDGSSEEDDDSEEGDDEGDVMKDFYEALVVKSSVAPPVEDPNYWCENADLSTCVPKDTQKRPLLTLDSDTDDSDEVSVNLHPFLCKPTNKQKKLRKKSKFRKSSRKSDDSESETTTARSKAKSWCASVGVTMTPSNTYNAKIRVGNTRIDLGTFPTEKQASDAYQAKLAEVDRTQYSTWVGVTRESTSHDAYPIWKAQIKVGKSMINLGSFLDEISAAKEFDKACIEHGRKPKNAERLAKAEESS